MKDRSRVKRVLEATQLPTVALTGDEEENLGAKAVRAGADDDLVKGDGHGGEIACTSREGEGICFTVHLPDAERT